MNHGKHELELQNKQKNNIKQKIRVYSALYSEPNFDNSIFVTELQILEIGRPRSSECKTLL